MATPILTRVQEDDSVARFRQKINKNFTDIASVVTPVDELYAHTSPVIELEKLNVDCDTVTEEWHVGGSTSGTHYPVNGAGIYWHVHTISNTAQTGKKQIAYGVSSTNKDRMFTRTYSSSAWSAWVEMASTQVATGSTAGLESAADKTKVDAIATYPVASGVSGNWNYKKFSDGTFEAFTVAAIDSGTLTMTQISTSAMYASNTLTLTLPSIGIVQVRHANFEQLTASYTTSIAKNNGVGATVTYQVNKNGSSTSAVTHTAHIWGTWS